MNGFNAVKLLNNSSHFEPILGDSIYIPVTLEDRNNERMSQREILIDIHWKCYLIGLDHKPRKKKFLTV